MIRLSSRRRLSLGRLVSLLTIVFVMQSASTLPAQILEKPEEIVEPEPIWPDSLAFIEYDREARPINLNDIRRQIGYPQILKEAGIPPDKVIVRILLDEYGHYVRHFLVKEAHPEFMKVLEPLIPEMMWLPAEKGGRPVSSWITIPFNFCFPK